MVGKRNPRPKTRIVTRDEEGREIDLHALRVTLGTALARAGVAPQVAQKIMRHADYRTTLQHYTVLGLRDTAKAIEELPLPVEENSGRNAATGTHGGAGALLSRANYIDSNSRPKSAKNRKVEAPREHQKPENPFLRKHPKDTKFCTQTDIHPFEEPTAGDRIRTDDVQLGKLAFYH